MHTVCSLAGCIDRFDVFNFNPKSSTFENMFFFANPEVNDERFRDAAVADVFRIGTSEIFELLPRFRPAPGVVKSVYALVKLE